VRRSSHREGRLRPSTRTLTIQYIYRNHPTRHGNDDIPDCSTSFSEDLAVLSFVPVSSAIRKSGKGGPGKRPRIENSAYDCVTEGVITSINCLTWPGLWIQNAN
jgi:hypothetical protein